MNLKAFLDEWNHKIKKIRKNVVWAYCQAVHKLQPLLVLLGHNNPLWVLKEFKVEN